ncbi:hypothetical protein ACRAWF_18480 [Streptomyces sp. L7]
MAPITTIAMNSLPRRLGSTASAANSALRQIGSALGPAIFGVILTQPHPGHPARPCTCRGSGLSPADQGQVIGTVNGVGIQAGAFLHLNSGEAIGRALAATRGELHRRAPHLRASSAESACSWQPPWPSLRSGSAPAPRHERRSPRW